MSETKSAANDNGSEIEFDGRIGSKMILAVRKAARCEDKGIPVKSKNRLAVAVGANNSQKYGYETVNRALDRDLLTIDDSHPAADNRGKGAVFATDKGRALLDSLDN